MRKLIEPLCGWYQEHKRDLPWRRQKDAYHVWVSEIMLQQTRVEAVIPYYERFMASLPDIRSLAECPEDVLLKLWEGLGYYSRVRNMQKAAVIIAESAPSADVILTLPARRDELLRLPGIGEYTAGAIASIACGQPVPAVDGNVLRVFSRLYADGRDIRKQVVKKEYTRQLEDAMQAFFTDMPAGPFTPGDFNQALMDLGAMICLPNTQPHCGKCPLAVYCKAHEAQEETRYPFRAEKKARRVEDRTVLLVRDGKHTALRRRPAKGLLAGMYEFPNLEGTADTEQALKAVEEAGFIPLQILPLRAAKHIFTHVEWHMTAYEIRIAEPEEGQSPGTWILADTDRIEKEYPIPSAFSSYAGYLQIRTGAEAKRQDMPDNE